MPSKDVNSSASNDHTDIAEDTENENCLELVKADPDLLEAISKDTTHSVKIHGVSKEIRLYGDTAVVFEKWDDPREIKYQNATRQVLIDHTRIECSVDKFTDFSHTADIRPGIYKPRSKMLEHLYSSSTPPSYLPFNLISVMCNQVETKRRIKLGTMPTRELCIDDKWFHSNFDGEPIRTKLGIKEVCIEIKGPAPPIIVSDDKRTDLVLGQVNLVVNSVATFPVYLDAKPQIFEIEGKPITLEFIDCFKRVVLNGSPVEFEFEKLLKPIKFNGKKYTMWFTELPKPFKAGSVKVKDMKGEEPVEIPKLIRKSEDADGNSKNKRKKSFEDSENSAASKRKRTDLFFSQMSEIVHGLSEKRKKRLEREISALVYKAEDEEYNENYCE